MSDIKKNIYLHKDMAILSWAVAAGGAIAGAIMDYFTGLAKEGAYLGFILAPMVLLMMSLFLGMMDYSNSFDRALRCNYTRRKFLVFGNLSYFLVYVTAMLLVLLVSIIETAIFQRMYGTATVSLALEMGNPFFWAVILLGCFTLTSFICFMGSVYSRVGKTAFWVVWALWMILCVGTGAIASRFGDTEFFNKMVQVFNFLFGTLTRTCITILIFGLIFQMVGAVLVLRQAVKD
ncbi:MAG: hypothetical protein K5682_07120 [Lachnospiraceae bacterium]|nr:hypothetical protein [Lachnospiraceae bacterium]